MTSAFNVSTRKITKKTARAMSQIAKKHNAKFIWADLPEGTQHWFVCENLGSSYVDAVKHAVNSDLIDLLNR